MPRTIHDTNGAFDLVVAGADAPVWIVTTVAEGRRAGCLIGFGGQVSIEPRRFLVNLSKRNRTYEVAGEAHYLAVHVLPEESGALAQLFGSETGFELDKFEHCEWHAGPHGLPILAAAAGWFVGEIMERHDFGDHVGMVLDITDARAPHPDISPLRYSAVADLTPGRPA
ncbi:flavin reductase family protein [Nocardia yunnanensis]|uniref:flavin reductase family protein n=1 Tax=Nocardia yunnanensis TaxID=2382165 RepID=UPI001FE9733E|nr:flavin reductase family protein [Nocardia yunnanensis]